MYINFPKKLNLVSMCKILTMEIINGVKPERIIKVGISKCGDVEVSVRWDSSVAIL